MGTSMSVMGNELADAIRAELHRITIDKYGSLDNAAPALDIPYKTLYRALTAKGKDRTQRVTLDFVLELCSKLGVDLNYVYSRAETANVGGERETVDSPHQRDYDLVAHPYTEETGELMDE